MKITIDTKEDSNEEIKKLIKMLSSLIGEDYKKEDETPEVSEGVFNMFDSSAEEKKEEDKEEKPFELNDVVTY